MALWNRWLPDVLVHVPGCPNVLVRHHVLRAAQAFLTTSRAWQQILSPVAVAANQDEVTLTAPDAQSRSVRAESAWWDGVQLAPTAPDELDKLFSDDWMAHTGTPTHFMQLRPGTVRLYPVPNAPTSVGIKVRVSLVPSDAATGLPDDLADRYVDEIAQGATGRLMLLTGKPWSNPDLGAAYMGAFDAAANAAKVDAARGRVGARLRPTVKWC